MFKKKGLRPLRNAIILFIVILIVPLIFLFLSRAFFTAPPICPEYKEILKKAKTSENGYIYFEGALNISERIFCGYFSPIQWYVYIQKSPDSFQFEYDKVRLKHYSGYDFAMLYRFLIKEKLIQDEFDSYSKYKYLFTVPTDKKKPDHCISPEKDWKTDFLRHSQDVLNNIKKANKKDFFLPYNSKVSPALSSEWNLLLIEFANILIYLENGDYQSASDWLETFNHFLTKFDSAYNFNSIMSKHLLFVIRSVALYPSLHDPFYEDLLCSLSNIKDEVKSKDFKTIYQKSLFFFENYFVKEHEILMNGNPTQTMPKLLSMFLSYNDISRRIDKHRPTFETSTWKDLENAVFYNKGELYNALTDINSLKKRKFYYEPEFWKFYSGDIWQDLLLEYNATMSTLYGSILTVLLEQYHAKNGKYPNSLDKIINDYFSDEELAWMDEYIDLCLTPENYYIDYYPIPIRGREPRKAEIFRLRKMYHIKGQ
ncbi:MAG TPA: hypothetical protein PLX23_02175 [Candidatus Hydrogenedens sp.]|nr:hypothetical protein [Candidatus Hydrogenedens sp.]